MIPIGINASAKSPSGIILTAGTASFYAGYSNGAALPAFGSVTSEPLAGQTMNALIYHPSGVSTLQFAGDVVSIISTMTLYVDDAPYSLASAATGSGVTNVQWSGNTGPIFTDGISYTIRIE